jgi:hypothetical protein
MEAIKLNPVLDNSSACQHVPVSPIAPSCWVIECSNLNLIGFAAAPVALHHLVVRRFLDSLFDETFTDGLFVIRRARWSLSRRFRHPLRDLPHLFALGEFRRHVPEQFIPGLLQIGFVVILGPPPVGLGDFPGSTFEILVAHDSNTVTVIGDPSGGSTH